MLLALGPLDKVKDYMDKELLDETKLDEKFLDWELDTIQQGKVKDWIGYFKRTWCAKHVLNCNTIPVKFSWCRAADVK